MCAYVYKLKKRKKVRDVCDRKDIESAHAKEQRNQLLVGVSWLMGAHLPRFPRPAAPGGCLGHVAKFVGPAGLSFVI
jgi:hypothetical protein